MNRQLPPAGSWYAVPVSGRLFEVPSDCACCGLAAGRASLQHRERLLQDLPPLCEPCRVHVGELAQVSRTVLVSGACLGLAAALLLRGPLGEGPGAALGLAVSWLPLLLQPRLRPLVELPPGHGARALPWTWRPGPRGDLELVTASGRLAAWLAVRNRAVPRPLPGAGPERATGLAMLSGAGGGITVSLALWQLVLVLAGRLLVP